MFKEELPVAVHDELDRRGLNGVPVVLCASSELSLAGEPERNWIVETKDNITAVRETDANMPSCAASHSSPNGHDDGQPSAVIVEMRVPVSEVREFRTK